MLNLCLDHIRKEMVTSQFPWASRACMQAQHKRYGCAGYSHLTGGYPGGQAQYARVPYGIPACNALASWRHEAL